MLVQQRDDALRQKRNADTQLGEARREAELHKQLANRHKLSADEKEADRARLAKNVQDKETELANAKAAADAASVELQGFGAAFDDFLTKNPQHVGKTKAELLRLIDAQWKEAKAAAEAKAKDAEDEKAAIAAELQAEKSKRQHEEDTHADIKEIKQELKELKKKQLPVSVHGVAKNKDQQSLQQRVNIWHGSALNDKIAEAKREAEAAKLAKEAIEKEKNSVIIQSNSSTFVLNHHFDIVYKDAELHKKQRVIEEMTRKDMLARLKKGNITSEDADKLEKIYDEFQNACLGEIKNLEDLDQYVAEHLAK